MIINYLRSKIGVGNKPTPINEHHLSYKQIKVFDVTLPKLECEDQSKAIHDYKKAKESLANNQEQYRKAKILVNDFKGELAYIEEEYKGHEEAYKTQYKKEQELKLKDNKFQVKIDKLKEELKKAAGNPVKELEIRNKIIHVEREEEPVLKKLKEQIKITEDAKVAVDKSEKEVQDYEDSLNEAEIECAEYKQDCIDAEAKLLKEKKLLEDSSVDVLDYNSMGRIYAVASYSLLVDNIDCSKYFNIKNEKGCITLSYVATKDKKTFLIPSGSKIVLTLIVSSE